MGSLQLCTCKHAVFPVTTFNQSQHSKSDRVQGLTTEDVGYR